MRVVLDTVIFVRALINPAGRWGRVVYEYGARYDLIVSRETVSEVASVIARPKVAKRLPRGGDPREIARLLAIVNAATIVEPAERISISRDPKDNKFFECAVAGGADYIVGEDRDILEVGRFRGIETLSAAQFLDVLEKAGPA